jgi:hypothetical protein
MAFCIYQTVNSSIRAEFDAAVTKLLAEGWQLYGNPFVSQSGHFCQAMIKEQAG